MFIYIIYVSFLNKIQINLRFINNDDHNHEQFFTDAERIMMVYDTLIRTEYDAIPIRHTNNLLEDAKYHVGVDRMVATGAYTCAYPLHEVCLATKIWLTSIIYCH
jgi:phospholipid N-methyltransferase